MRTIKTIFETRVVRRAVAAVAVILAASAGSLLASGALASTAKQTQAKHVRAGRKRSGLAVFSHALSWQGARTASAGGVQAPPGAVLAAVSGKNAIYVWQPTASEETQPMRTADNGDSTCMVEMLNGLESIACGPTTTIEDRGIIGIKLPSMSTPTLGATALVPNGVTSVTVTDNNGSTHAVAVSDNSVFIEDPNLASVSFELPNGEVNSETVSEVMANRGALAAP